jgi:tRNA A-37 threonylcarbamoyl transferase component Bud32
MNCPRCDSPAPTGTLQQFGGVCPKCLLDFAEEQDAPSFPGLEIESLLGQGGMGVVYKARQKHLGRTVALKVLSPQLAADPPFVERFTREAKALAQLSHPNIVGIHDFGVHDGVPYLVMEYVDGTPLRKLLAAKKLAPERALEIVPQICDALQYAHSRGVVHRDIKPENVLLDREGRVKIADFGLAKLAAADETRITRTNVLMGSPSYMAPEQVEKPHAVDHRADIYSLGVVFYEMLTGELPIGRFKAPSERAAVDRRLDPVVLKSLEKEPDERYQSAGEVKEHVTRLESAPPPVERRAGAAAEELSRPSELAYASLVLALLQALGYLFFDGLFWSFFNGMVQIAADIVGSRQNVAVLYFLGTATMGFAALVVMVRRREPTGSWAAGAGIVLSAALLPFGMSGNDLRFVSLHAVPAMFLAQGALQGWIWRGRFPAVRPLFFLSGLLLATALVALIEVGVCQAARLYWQKESLHLWTLGGLLSGAAFGLSALGWRRRAWPSPPGAAGRRLESAPEKPPRERRRLTGAIREHVARFRAARGLAGRRQRPGEEGGLQALPPVSPLATAALVCLLLGSVGFGVGFALLGAGLKEAATTFFLVGGCLLLAAATLSVLALLQIAMSRRPLQGTGRAVTCLIVSVVFWLFVFALFFGSAAPEPAPAPVPPPPFPRPVPEREVRGKAFRNWSRIQAYDFRLVDAWPAPEDLPEGVEFVHQSEGRKAAEEMLLPGGVLEDLALVRRSLLAEGRLELLGLEFRTELARRRWMREPGFCDVVTGTVETQGDKQAGASLIVWRHAGSPLGAAASDLLSPVLRRKIEEAQSKLRREPEKAYPRNK